MIVPTFIFRTKLSRRGNYTPIYYLIIYVNKFFINIPFREDEIEFKRFRACEIPIDDTYRIALSFSISDTKCIYQNMKETGPDSFADMRVKFENDSYTISDQYDPILYAYFYKLKEKIE